MTAKVYTIGRFCRLLLFTLIWLQIPSCLWGKDRAEFDGGVSPLELSGPTVGWRFVNAVGERAGIWGFENGVLEGWVYPLKIFHDFNLAFQLEGSPAIYAGEQLIRAVRVRPESVDRIRTAKHTVDGGREASLEIVRPVSASGSKLWV